MIWANTKEERGKSMPRSCFESDALRLFVREGASGTLGHDAADASQAEQRSAKKGKH